MNAGVKGGGLNSVTLNMLVEKGRSVLICLREKMRKQLLHSGVGWKNVAIPRFRLNSLFKWR